MSAQASRSRWAAIGAAIAVTLGAGGVGISQATTSSGEKPVYIPLDAPCRLADNRPAGIGSEASATFDGWGTVGECTLPSGTSGLALNVTAVDATQQTNLRFYPADVPVPATANLNPTPGAPPIPNAVNVGLDATGKFKVFNKFGNVAIIIDVMGVYDDHNHDDRYYTEAEVDAALLRTAGVEFSRTAGTITVPNSPTVVESIAIDAPSAGFVVLNASGWATLDSGVSIRCGISTNSSAFEGDQGASAIGAGNQSTVSMTKGYEVAAGQTTFYFLCRRDNAGANIPFSDRNMTAVYSVNRQ